MWATSSFEDINHPSLSHFVPNQSHRTGRPKTKNSWNKNWGEFYSSVMIQIHIPSSWMNLLACQTNVHPVSIATGIKMCWLCWKIFMSLKVAAWLANTATSISIAHEIWVTLSTLLLSGRDRLMPSRQKSELFLACLMSGCTLSATSDLPKGHIFGSQVLAPT